MFSSENKVAFLYLVRLGLGHYGGNIPEIDDWNAIEKLAAEQGLSAILVDGIERLPEGQRPPKPVLLQWIGETLQGYEYRYEQYRKAIAEMAAFYNQHGLKMMVLKGYAFALDWSKPEHRPCGDIDIWLFGSYKEADRLLLKEKSIVVDSTHIHHTVFSWGDFMVENHYDIVDTVTSRSNVRIERLFKKLAMDDTHSVEVYGEKVYIPSPNFHALFLLRHAIMHFTGEGITIRHALDWGFFVKANGQKIDWEWLITVLTEYGMDRFFYTLNAICIDYLGFDVDIFPQVRFEPIMKKRVLEELLSFTSPLGDEPKGLIKRGIFKYHRRKAREWKHKLCYKEPLWSHLLSSLWLHITHPGMI